MKNLYNIILLLILVSNTMHLDIYAAGKRKAEVDPENEPHCSKRSRALDTEIDLMEIENDFHDLCIQNKKRKSDRADIAGVPVKKSHNYNKEQAVLDFNLFEAARTSNVASVATLLGQNANPNALTSYYYERTPLHIAARNSNLDCVQLLLQNGAKVNSVTDHFLTPLHEAVCVFDRNSGVACIEFLLQNGAKINAQTDKNNTPLHLAAMFCHHYYVKVLLEFGADRTLRNAAGKTPLMIAEDKRFGAIIDLLKR